MLPGRLVMAAASKLQQERGRNIRHVQTNSTIAIFLWDARLEAKGTDNNQGNGVYYDGNKTRNDAGV